MPKRKLDTGELTSGKTTDERPTLVLYRNDLRIADNGALAAAADRRRPVIAAYILDKESEGMRPPGGAFRWWLHRSLVTLGKDLADLGIVLVLRRGPMRAAVEALVSESDADAVFWNRRYEPVAVEADMDMKRNLRNRGLHAESFAGQLLHEPHRLKTGAGAFYKVFTPFWNALHAGPEPRDPIDRPRKLPGYAGRLETEALDDLLPLPARPDWAGGLRETWTPGEAGATALLSEFLAEGLHGYAEGRDLPGEAFTSRLSPHLAHGEITPFQVLAALKTHAGEADGADVLTFRKEIAWREFCYHLLFHNPRLHTDNFQSAFDAFPWRSDKAALRAWRRGTTGYPMVDAGMRELWQTGTMHNRVRMIAASFLTKHLLIDWRQGELWFWDRLVDADLASNPANWQWVAGCGADAASYFRIFNPVTQGEKFDGGGAYVRRFVPELAELPDKYLHRPWEAPAAVLTKAGVRLGETYPGPIVDHAKARQRALAAYASAKGETP
ncbi:DNA photolyase family protein [Rhizobium sp. TRM95111]|uniref:cryptochrome/photolyase family protein n=1 Tax=Rhizobium alarense TaxID=2846851 RepID=UPI001F31FAAC|nr:deoxyribodipyrimidine photo-lyase [Rhizobium alarense]MCF3641864.1 DNA photolyase family protein [Rhizobium alarense]